MYCSLILHDFAFTEHYFFDKIAILTKLSATIWFKLLESAYNNTLCADQFESSTSPPRATPRAFELWKIGLFKFPSLGAKEPFKCPTN